MDFEVPFVGRKDILDRIEAQWDRYRLFGIYGLRSVGKTRLTQKIIHNNKKLDAETTNIWIDLRKSSSLRRIYLHLCEKLNIQNIFENDDDLLAEICKKLDTRKTTFIVFDNSEGVIDNPEMYIKFKDITEFILQCCNGVKIFVTSTSDPEFTGDYVSTVDVPSLSEMESKELLRNAAPSVDFGDYLQDIVTYCEGLPLALLMIASELEDKMSSIYSPEDIVTNFTKTSRLQVLSGEFYPKEEQFDYIYLSYLKRLTEEAQRRLAVLGYIPGTFNVHQASEMLDDVSDEVTMETTLKPMTRSYVTKFDQEKNRFDIYTILRECLENFLKIENVTDVRKRYCSIFSKILQEIILRFRTKHFMEALATFNLEHQNFLKLFTDVIYSTEDTYPVFIDLARKATGEIQYFMAKEGFHFYEQCIRLCIQNKMKVDEALVRVSYGAALTNIKEDLKNGEDNYRLAIDVLEKSSFSNVKYELAFAYQRLGWNIGSQGKIQEALSILTMALELENDLGLQHDTLILQTLNTLGVFHVYAGNFEAAEEFHLESLKRRIEVYKTEDHPFIGSVKNNIGELFRGKGNIDKAHMYFQQSLDIKIRTGATDHSVVMSETNVALSMATLGQFKEAFDTLDDATNRLSKYPGLYEDTKALVKHIRGQVFYEQNKLKLAKKFLKEALIMRREILPDGLNMVESLLYLGKCYLGLSKYEKALQILSEALELKESVYEMPTSTLIVDTYEALEKVYTSLNDMLGLQKTYEGKAKELYRLVCVYDDFGNRQKMDYFQNKLSNLECKIKMFEF